MSRSAARPIGGSSADLCFPVSLDSLEPRLVLASTFASAGLFYQPGLASQEVISFSTEGTLSDALTVNGSRYRSDSGDREFEGGLRYDSISNFADGRFDRNPPEGFFGEPFERNGARFLNTDGYPVGWWFSDYNATSKEVEFLVQRPTSPTSINNFRGDYRFTMAWNDTGDSLPTLGSGALTINGSEILYDADTGDIPYGRSQISTVSTTGLLRTARDEYVYLSASGATIVWADQDDGEDVVSLGVATVPNGPNAAADMIGGYLLAWNDTSTGLALRQLYLDLEADGDYKFYDLDDYDDGKRDSIDRGFWSVSGNTLTLDQLDTQLDFHFTIGEDGRVLIAEDRNLNGTESPAFGLGVRALPNGAPTTVVFPVGAVNEFNRGVVYELESNEAWFVTDLVLKAGGPSITGKIVVWTDPKDHLSYAAGLAPEGLVVYSSTADHGWSFRVMSAPSLALPISKELQVMISPDGLVHLTGLDANGQVLRHYQTGTKTSGQWNYGFQNISTNDLQPQGLPTPEFTGLVSYATAWGGLNIAGLDAQGTIWSVWWAPTMTLWTASDLTRTYGAVPLTGGLTVYLTPWQGINIAGIDSQGHLRVTWWVPSFQDEWLQDDLTSKTGGPLLVPNSVSSYTSSWGGLNVAGIDSGTGDIFVYWWSPAIPDWTFASITASVPAGSPRMVGPMMGQAAPDASLNIYGYNSTNFIRYFWEPTFGAAWSVENLTDVATPR